MLRIAISCGEGFSSGYLAKRLQEAVVKENLTEIASFVRIPFPDLPQHQDEVDIAMIMPHMEFQARKSTTDWKIPLFIMSYKVPVKPTVYDFIVDAHDIMKLADGKTGLIYFPDEMNIARVSRNESHRAFEFEKEEKEEKKREAGH